MLLNSNYSQSLGLKPCDIIIVGIGTLCLMVINMTRVRFTRSSCIIIACSPRHNHFQFDLTLRCCCCCALPHCRFDRLQSALPWLPLLVISTLLCECCYHFESYRYCMLVALSSGRCKLGTVMPALTLAENFGWPALKLALGQLKAEICRPQPAH